MSTKDQPLTLEESLSVVDAIKRWNKGNSHFFRGFSGDIGGLHVEVSATRCIIPPFRLKEGIIFIESQLTLNNRKLAYYQSKELLEKYNHVRGFYYGHLYGRTQADLELNGVSKETSKKITDLMSKGLR